jgi:hypothetical protein
VLAPAPVPASALARAPAASAVPASAPRIPAVASSPPVDFAALAREERIDIDISPFDGRRRRRQMLLYLLLGILVVFGSLFAMLALSYTHVSR